MFVFESFNGAEPRKVKFMIMEDKKQMRVIEELLKTVFSNALNENVQLWKREVPHLVEK